MPRATRSSGRRPTRSTPSYRMRPDRTGSRPITALSSVVLPTPLRPMRQTTPPSGTSSDTSHRTWLDVPEGGVVCLMGRNGVGKTTLLKAVIGLLPARSGSIILDGIDLGSLRPEERAACGIGYVPQGREIFPNLTVSENLRVGFLGRPKVAGNGRVAQTDIEQVFDLFPKLRQLLSRKGGVLSGGEQQQLAIARVLLARPKLLLMDEPTEGIQPNVILQIEDAIQRIKERGIAVLLV